MARCGPNHKGGQRGGRLGNYTVFLEYFTGAEISGHVVHVKAHGSKHAISRAESWVIKEAGAEPVTRFNTTMVCKGHLKNLFTEGWHVNEI